MPQDLYNKTYHTELTKVTWIGFFLNLILVLLKIVVGYFSRSQALIADGFHSLSDGVTDLAVLLGKHFWTAPADEEHPHGHGRIEMLITIFIGILLGIAGIFLASNSIKTLSIDRKETILSLPIIIIAGFSIISKEILYRYTVFIGKKIQSSAVIANAWHHRSDSLSSIPVAIAGIGIMISPSYQMLDPLGALLVSIFIIYSAYQIVHPMLNYLIDQGMSNKEIEQLNMIARSIEGVKSIHAIRSRHIGGGIAIDLHVLVNPELTVKEGHLISGKVKRALLERGENIIDVLIHIEPYEEKPKEEESHKM